jgi:hypothetical protein
LEILDVNRNTMDAWKRTSWIPASWICKSSPRAGRPPWFRPNSPANPRCTSSPKAFDSSTAAVAARLRLSPKSKSHAQPARGC